MILVSASFGSFNLFDMTSLLLTDCEVKLIEQSDGRRPFCP